MPSLNEPLRLNASGGGGAETVSVKALVTEAGVLSVRVTLNVKAPTVVGVPESVPPAKAVPGGRLPPALRLYGGTPPVPPKAMAMGVPVGTGPAGPPVMFNGAGRIVMLNPPDSVAPAESVTTTEKENRPGVFGVPEINPPEERDRPSGRLPPPMEKVYDPVPPLAKMKPV